jgi:hypothetical protein
MRLAARPRVVRWGAGRRAGAPPRTWPAPRCALSNRRLGIRVSRAKHVRQESHRPLSSPNCRVAANGGPPCTPSAAATRRLYARGCPAPRSGTAGGGAVTFRRRAHGPCGRYRRRAPLPRGPWATRFRGAAIIATGDEEHPSGGPAPAPLHGATLALHFHDALDRLSTAKFESGVKCSRAARLRPTSARRLALRLSWRPPSARSARTGPLDHVHAPAAVSPDVLGDMDDAPAALALPTAG